MRYGFVIPGGDVETVISVAQEVEEAGWDAVFVADGIYGIDPWIVLAAIAVQTKRVKIGTLLTPASRRRPWKLASELATLDHLSHGRVILSVGLGAIDTGFDKVGEQTDRKVRAQLLDECLEVMTSLWSGRPFRFDGTHYHVNWDVAGSYTPVQTPRIPIWVVGLWPSPRSMQRPLRYDGLLPTIVRADGSLAAATVADVQAIKQFSDEQRSDKQTPFDIVVEGVTPIDAPKQAPSIVAPFAQAGATWWIELMWDVPGGMDAVRTRIKQGPPRI